MYMICKKSCSLWNNKNKSLNIHIFIQFEIKITFQNKTQNLVESLHFLKILSYSWKVNTKNVMY
jgi:hypothetical protein